MVERPWTGQLPPVHPDPHGLPPQPDGQTVPQPPRRLPLATGQFVVTLAVCAVIVLVLMAVGIAGVTL